MLSDDWVAKPRRREHVQIVGSDKFFVKSKTGLSEGVAASCDWWRPGQLQRTLSDNRVLSVAVLGGLSLKAIYR
jgi:hypothetical protein